MQIVNNQNEIHVLPPKSKNICTWLSAPFLSKKKIAIAAYFKLAVGLPHCHHFTMILTVAIVF
jgi:hypothetical protein